MEYDFDVDGIVSNLEKIEDGVQSHYGFEIETMLQNNTFNNDEKYILEFLRYMCGLSLEPKNKDAYYQSLNEKKLDIKIDTNLLNKLPFLLKSDTLHYKLKSRLADILWLKSDDKNKIDYAKVAIENYMKYPLNIIYRNEWDRAISLSISTKKPIDEIKKRLLTAFEFTDDIDTVFASLLEEHDKKYFEDEKDNLIRIIEDKIKTFTSNYDKQNFLEQYIKWYPDVILDSKYIELVKYYDETIKENKLNEVIGYDKIINCLKKIKNKKEHNVLEKLRKFQNLKIKFQKNIMYGKIEIPIDISKTIDETQQLLKDKPIIEILYLLASFNDNIIDALSNLKKSDSEKGLETITKNLGLFHKDGRKIAKEFSDEHRYYNDYIQIFVHSRIIPALRILSEYKVTQKIIFELCQKSSFIPSDRINLWSKGIYYGVQKDFMIATSLLVPQIEHLLRTNLKNIDKNTINNKTNDGVEEEIGLERLLEENIKKGDNNKYIYQELQLLLTKPFNLRNDIAHGLIDDKYFTTHLTIYFWWLILKLIISDIKDKEEKK